MKYFYGIVLTAVVTAAATALLYEPVSLAVYKMREPYFGLPVKFGTSGPIIRNDVAGDGEYGAKRRNGRSHSGIDILSPVGTPVYAAKSGMAFKGYVPTGYGRYVMIYHPDGFQTLYGHLSNWAFYAPQKVSKGDLIGFVGKTGNAGGKAVQPHLHFEIRKDGDPQDPQSLIR